MVTKQTYKTRERWLAARNDKPVLGSSDVGTIMGLNPYVTPYEYWLNQKSPGSKVPESENLWRGIIKEDGIAKMFEHLTGEKIIRKSKQLTVYRNDKYPDYVQVAPDRELFAKGRKTRIGVECKDTKLYIPQLDADNCPPAWYVQIQYQMGVMEREAWYIAADEGGKDLVYGLFPFKQEVFDVIYNYCTHWFECYILGDETPPLETASDALLAYPFSKPQSTQYVSEEVAQAVERLKEKKKIAKVLSEQIEDLETTVKLAFGDSEGIAYNGNVIATWTTQMAQRINIEAFRKEMPEIAMQYSRNTTTRVLRLKK